MKTTIKQEANEIVAIFEGRLDTAASSIVSQEIEPLCNCNDMDVILDCTQLEYISSSGLRIFLGVLKSAKPKGCQVFIKGLNDDLKKVFAITGFDQLFQFK